MKEALKNAYADAEKMVQNVDANMGAMVDKMKAQGPEERMQASLKADRKKADAEDKAEARKIEHHAEEAPPPAHGNSNWLPSHPISQDPKSQS
ncbi:hypothetical protein GOP47_0020949 [Adiantum capillus-veneris]|uniref:Uncharacterized protein n=1 Tax=Adiantum capillus-veneris TaxID=13818 RepID=A0A9D4UA55_ADICA|nr:hypothetical protein GOP47_0020949 [Adiantum capillus-veneris]